MYIAVLPYSNTDRCTIDVLFNCVLEMVLQASGCGNLIFSRMDGKRRSSNLWLPVEAPKADDWELPSPCILLADEEPLGEGCFGTVHRAVVKGPILHSRTMKNTICMNVAVKFLKSEFF